MSHLAAISPAAKAPLAVQTVPTPKPGPHELLIKNELTALQPIDAKLAKDAVFPVAYPVVFGSAYGGTVTAVGEGVTKFKVGDRVTASKTGGAAGNAFGAFQQYVLAKEVTASRVPAAAVGGGGEEEEAALHAAVGLVGNLPTVVGLLTLSAGLDRPDLLAPTPPAAKAAKVLIYGGTSSVGSLATQYAAQAGYAVVTTTSPPHQDLVARLGARLVVDHTQDRAALTQALVAAGPYDLVVDAISLPETIPIVADVLSAQGGGPIYALLGPSGGSGEPESLPPGVTRKSGAWSAPLADPENQELLAWAFGTYLTTALAQDRLVALPTQTVKGDLHSINEALALLYSGVSGLKVVVDPGE